ncbi:MAG: hypothetical protein QOI88_2227 [Gammaproteobacteria bacterium]|nr:hypothetical protein [Gammaproteobacteria bacterium]
MGKPLAEVEIDPAMAHRLVLAQHPDLAHLAVVAVGSGWDNAMFRLGDNLALRFPRRETAAKLLLNEQRWLPHLCGRLPLAVPVPVHIGAPQHGYPWPWSITPWIEGETADVSQPDEHQGEVLAGFFEALHQPAPADAPFNSFRGVPLAERAAAFEDRVSELSGKTDMIDRRVRSLWEDALGATAEVAPTWIHGDPHPRNVLVVAGRFSGVIDWGDMAQGDRAADLAAIWMLLPQLKSRERAMAACSSVPSDTWRRARGWAVLYAVILLRAGLSNDPRMYLIAQRTVQRLLEGPR